MTTKGVLSGWHNVSTNKDLSIDGISVQDILGIISSIKQKSNFLTWKDLIDQLFNHVSDKNNPHRLTPDQLATTVIQLVYEAWLLEGYNGSLNEFIDLLFRYLEYADQSIMDEGVSDEHIPPVHIFSRYVKNHNENLESHEDKFKSFFSGSGEISDPVRSFRQIMGISESDANFINEGNTHYERLFILNGRMHDEFTFIMSFKFENFPVFQLNSGDGSAVIRVTSQPDENRILFTRCLSESSNSLINTSILDNLTNIPNTTIDEVAIPNDKDTVKCYVMGKGKTLTYGLYFRSLNKFFDLSPAVIEIDLQTSVEVPTEPRPIVDPVISFARMSSSDFLTDLLYYPQYFTLENIEYVIEWLDGNVRESNILLDPEDPLNPYEIVNEPTVPTEPESAPVVFLASGKSGSVLSSSTTEAWRSIVTFTEEDIVRVVRTPSKFVSVTRGGKIFESVDGKTWNFISQIDNVFVTDLFYMEGLFVLSGLNTTVPPENGGNIFTSRNAVDWLNIHENYGPGFNSVCLGSYIGSYYKNILLVAAGNSGKVGYMDLEDYPDSLYINNIPAGPSGLCDFQCIAYGNNKYVAAGTGAQVTMSEGNVWSWSGLAQIGSDPTIVWRHIEFINPMFVMLGDGGYLTISTNGLTWSTPVKIHELSDPIDSTWNDIIRHLDRYVLVGNTGRISTSLDLVNWAAPIQQSTNDLLSVVGNKEKKFDGDQLFALDGTNKIFNSKDFLTWSSITKSVYENWYHLIYGNGVWIAVGQRGMISRSTDGINWSPMFTVGIGTFTVAEFLLGKFFLIGTEGHVYTSTDGLSWTLVAILSSYYGYGPHGLSANGNQTLILAFGNYYFRSVNGGTTWTKVGYSSGYWASSAFGNGKFVMIGSAGKITSSVDGIAWSSVTAPLGMLSFNDIAFGNGRFVAVCGNNKVAYSADGVAWNFTTVGMDGWGTVDFDGTKFVITNAYQIAESADGITWSLPQTTPSSLTNAIFTNSNFYSLTSAGDIRKGEILSNMEFVKSLKTPVEFQKLIYGYSNYDHYMKPFYTLAVGNGGVYCYYEGQYGWTDVYMDYNHNWVGGVFSPSFNLWTLISSDGAIISSYNEAGWDWSFAPTVFPGIQWNGIADSEDLVVIVGSDGNILATSDLRNLPAPIQVSNQNWIDVRFTGELFVVLSEDGFISSSSNGADWSTPVFIGVTSIKDVTYNDNTFVFLTESGYVFKGDIQTLEFTTPSLVGAGNWIHLDYIKQHFVLYGTNSSVALSDSGENWREYEASSPINFMDMIAVPLVIKRDDGMILPDSGAPQ